MNDASLVVRSMKILRAGRYSMASDRQLSEISSKKKESSLAIVARDHGHLEKRRETRSVRGSVEN